MLSFTLRRLASMIVVLLVLTASLFILQQVSPIDPVRALVGQQADKAVVDAARKRLGYDCPCSTSTMLRTHSGATWGSRCAPDSQ